MFECWLLATVAVAVAVASNIHLACQLVHTPPPPPPRRTAGGANHAGRHPPPPARVRHHHQPQHTPPTRLPQQPGAWRCSPPHTLLGHPQDLYNTRFLSIWERGAHMTCWGIAHYSSTVVIVIVIAISYIEVRIRTTVLSICCSHPASLLSEAGRGRRAVARAT